MQTATLIVSVLSLTVSATTLAVVVIGAKRAQSLVLGATITAQEKIDGLKRAVAEL
jgi:hypothetical protein